MLEKRDSFLQFNAHAGISKLSPALEDEITEIDMSIQGGCTTNTFTLSNYLGNKGGWCTLTKECQPNCS